MTPSNAETIALNTRGQIQLKALSESFLPRFIALVRHPEVNPHLPFAPDFPEAKAQEMLAITQAESGCYAWMMVEQSSLEAVGVITVMPVFHAKCWQLGYWVDPAHQCNGYATMAVRMATQLGFEQLGIVRIQAQVALDNPASAKVLANAGFEKEALLRASHQLTDRLIDTELYAKIKGA